MGIAFEMAQRQIIAPLREFVGQILFLLNGKRDHVHIISNTSRLYDIIGSFVDDRRYLGVLIGGILLFKENKMSFVVMPF